MSAHKTARSSQHTSWTDLPEAIALWAHFPPIPVELKEEFDALERASDEDFARFEQESQDMIDLVGLQP